MGHDCFFFWDVSYSYVTIHEHAIHLLQGKVVLAHSHLGHDSFIFGTCLIHIRDVTYSYLGHASFFLGHASFFFGHDSFIFGNPWCVLLLLQGEVAWDFFTEGYEPLRLSAVYPRPHTRVRNNSVAIILSFSGVLHPGCNPNRSLL